MLNFINGEFERRSSNVEKPVEYLFNRKIKKVEFSKTPPFSFSKIYNQYPGFCVRTEPLPAVTLASICACGIG